MLRYLAMRIASACLVLVGLSLLACYLVRLVPGDAVQMMLGLAYDERIAAQLRDQLGLDQPFVLQYIQWIGGMFRGDFGVTLSGQPVRDQIAAALPVTLQLAGMAMAFAVVLGIPLGVFAAVNRGRRSDQVVSVVAVLGLSVPGFWLGTLLIFVFALTLGWLPSGNFVGLLEDPAGNLRHMLMPAIALGLAVLAVLVRTTRMAVLEVAGLDHVRTAHAKGLPANTVFRRHMLRNGLIPVLTIAGMQVGYLLGGSIVIEEVFSLPGMGRLILRATQQRDYALLQASILLIGAIFLALNLIVDMLYAWVDPRVSVEEPQA